MPTREVTRARRQPTHPVGYPVVESASTETSTCTAKPSGRVVEAVFGIENAQGIHRSPIAVSPVTTKPIREPEEGEAAAIYPASLTGVRRPMGSATECRRPRRRADLCS